MSSNTEPSVAGGSLLSDSQKACLEAGLQLCVDSEPTSLWRLNVNRMEGLVADHGPAVEQVVVRGLSDILEGAVRPSDAVEHTGNANFSVLFRNRPLERVFDTATRTQGQIEDTHFESRGRAFQVTVAGGLAVRQPDEDLAQLTARANAALQAAQARGVRQPCWHEGIPKRRLETPTFLRATPRLDPAPSSVVCPAETLAELEKLGGKTAFCQNLRRFLQAARASQTPLAVLLVKSYDFDALVAQYGRDAGELVLAGVLQMLRQSAFQPVLFGRYAEHTVSVLLGGPTALRGDALVASFEQAFSACVFLVDGNYLRTRLCLGLAQATPRDDMPTLITRAEEALHDAYRLGV